MDNTKSNSFFDQIIAKGNKSKYTAIYILKSVSCQNCGNMIIPNKVIWKTDVSLMQDIAELTHSEGVRANKVICSMPKLFIVYDNGFIDTSLLMLDVQNKG